MTSFDGSSVRESGFNEAGHLSDLARSGSFCDVEVAALEECLRKRRRNELQQAVVREPGGARQSTAQKESGTAESLNPKP